MESEIKTYDAGNGVRVTVPEREQYTLNGEPIDIDEFLDDNGFRDTATDERIASMKVGDLVMFGGGAGVTFELVRTA